MCVFVLGALSVAPSVCPCVFVCVPAYVLLVSTVLANTKPEV